MCCNSTGVALISLQILLNNKYFNMTVRQGTSPDRDHTGPVQTRQQGLICEAELTATTLLFPFVCERILSSDYMEVSSRDAAVRTSRGRLVWNSLESVESH